MLVLQQQFNKQSRAQELDRKLDGMHGSGWKDNRSKGENNETPISPYCTFEIHFENHLNYLCILQYKTKKALRKANK